MRGKGNEAAVLQYLVQKRAVVTVAAAALEEVLADLLTFSFGTRRQVRFPFVGAAVLGLSQLCATRDRVVQRSHPDELHHLGKHAGLSDWLGATLAVAEGAVWLAASALLPELALDLVRFAGFAVAEGAAVTLMREKRERDGSEMGERWERDDRIERSGTFVQCPLRK